jgi:hypothetical protein
MEVVGAAVAAGVVAMAVAEAEDGVVERLMLLELG